VSSFQLEAIDRFAPHVAVLTNLTPDHLDRYDGFDDYVRAKLKIFENQRPEDFAVINADDLTLRSTRRPLPRARGRAAGGALGRRRLLFSEAAGERRAVLPQADPALPALTNRERARRPWRRQPPGLRRRRRGWLRSSAGPAPHELVAESGGALGQRLEGDERRCNEEVSRTSAGSSS
jgi:hypothetical protein